jgi:hypothetical protein
MIGGSEMTGRGNAFERYYFVTSLFCSLLPGHEVSNFASPYIFLIMMYCFTTD